MLQQLNISRFSIIGDGQLYLCLGLLYLNLTYICKEIVFSIFPILFRHFLEECTVGAGIHDAYEVNWKEYNNVIRHSGLFSFDTVINNLITTEIEIISIN